MKHYDDRKWFLNFPQGALVIIITQLLFYLQMYSLLPKFVYIACDLYDVNEAEFDLALNAVIMVSLFAPLIISVVVESKGVGKYKMACILGVGYYMGMTFILVVVIIEDYKHFSEGTILIILAIGMSLTQMTSLSYAKVVNTLGAEQMKMPDEKDCLIVYFRLLYAIRNVASMVSMVMADNPKITLIQIMGMIYSLMTLVLLILVTSELYLIKRINDGNYLFLLFEELFEFCVTCNVKRTKNIDYHKRASLAENEMESRILQRYREEKTIEHFLRLLLPIFLYLLLNRVYAYIVQRQGDAMDRYISESLAIYFDRRTMSLIDPALKLSMSYLNHFILYPFFSLLGINSGLRRLMLGLFVQCVAFHMAVVLQITIVSMPLSKISILYQLPQYLMYSWSDSLFYVGGMTHAYMQAPITMRTFSVTLYAICIPVANIFIEYFQFLEETFFYLHDETIPFAIITMLSVWNLYFMFRTLKNYKFEVFHDVEDTNY